MAYDGTYLYRQTTGIVGVLIYHTGDSRATMLTTNYFNNGVDDLNLYDVIHCVLVTGGTIVFTTVCVTAINRTTGVVTVLETALS
jgi:hypothetical protein